MRIARKKYGVAIGVLLVAGRALLAAEPPPPTTEDLRNLAEVTAPALSPDGRQVLFSITDSTAAGGRAHLWVSATDGTGAALRLTSTPDGADAGAGPGDPHGETEGAWLPDGGGILFLAKRDKQRQLFTLPLHGGEATAYTLRLVPLTEPKAEPMPADITGFAVSPDGKTIAVLGHDPESADETKKQDGKDDGVWVDHDPHRARLALLELDPAGTVGGTVRAVSIPDDVEKIVWSPTSDRLIALSDAPNNGAGAAPVHKAWLVSVASYEHPEALPALPSTIERAAWSPDGQTLAFHAQAAADAPPGFDDLYLYSFAAKTVRNLSAGFSGAIGPEAPIFVADGKSVVQAVALGTKAGVAVFDVSGGKPKVLSLEPPVAEAFATNKAITGFVFVGSSGATPARPYATTSLDKPAHQLAVPPAASVSFATISPKIVQWQNEGLSLDGLLYLPLTAVAGHPVPLVVDVHGGPLGAWRDEFAALPDLLASHGWAVFRPNPRGSLGYGATFAAANKNDLGGGDFRDIMTGLDAVLKQYPIDPTRLALMGYSYGGEMAGFAEGKTDRFKTIISGAPVIDQNSEYGTEADESWYDQWYFGKPFEHPEDAWRQSPLSGVTKAKTPFLLLQGEGDSTDPAGQSHEMYRALRQEGVPAELVTYPRETHGSLSRGIHGYPVAEPWHGLDARNRIVDALEKALAGEGQ